MAPKRPPQDDEEAPPPTLVSDHPPALDEPHDGATAFVRVDALPPPPKRGAPAPVAEEPPDGATAFVRIDRPPPPSRASAPAASNIEVGGEPADGATAFVRIDRAPPPGGRSAASPPPRKPPAQSAPKKGLQIQLPDDEPPPPKPAPRAIAPAPEAKKGRRGAWWDEEAAKIPDEPEPPAEEAPAESDHTQESEPLHEEEVTEPSGDDAAGATAFVRVEPRVKAPAEPEVVAPKPRAPAKEEYKPLPAEDYGGHLRAGPSRWRVYLRRALIACVAMFLIGLVTLVAGYFYLARELPAMESVREYKPFVATKVLTADGTLVGQFFKEKRTVVKMDQIPSVLIQAVTSSEDKDFRKHPGVNITALLRAVVVDVLSGRKRLGASTITQQVVKNLMLTRDKKFKRKLKEVLLAWRLERNLSKDDILFLYLNQINFGKAHYGVEEASLYYFGKHVQELDLGEAALLAGLPQNPARLNPRRHPENAKRRQTYVLDRMLANGYIDQIDHDREVDKPLQLPLEPATPPGAWYLDEVRRQLVAQYGDTAVDTSGWTVEVMMDERLQGAAEQAVQDGLRAVDKRQGWRGPLFKIDAAQLGELAAATGKRLQQTAPPPNTVMALDLDGVAEKEQGSLDSIVRAASVRELQLGGVYAGVVSSVNPRDAHVSLGPGLDGLVPFATMSWARPFKPEQRTNGPSSPSQVVSVGDVVSVRVTDLQLNKMANSTGIKRLEFALEQTPEVQGAFAAIDLKTRGVVALVGGFDNARSQFDRATQAKRQPGSSFKPFLYAAAIESGKYTPSTKVDDSPEVINDPWSGKAYKPQNFEKDEFAGPITLRKALAESKNTVAVKLLLALGLDKVRAEAIQAGLTSTIPESATAALGTGEVGVLEEINAYATIASQGRKADPIFIKKVLSRDGQVVMKSEANLEQSLRADVAYVTADVMRSVIDDPDGTAHSLSVLGRPAAGKTGTASDHRDGWFIGFTPSLVAGAWVGFDDHKMLGSLETGGHCAGPIWLSFMRAATAGTSPEEFGPVPPGVVELKVNRNTGARASAGDPFAVREVFLSGTEPAAEETDRPLEPPSQEQFYQGGQ